MIVVPVRCGEESWTRRKALSLIVNFHFSTYLWSWVLGQDRKKEDTRWIQVGKMSFLGSYRDKVTVTRTFYWKETQVVLMLANTSVLKKLKENSPTYNSCFPIRLNFILGEGSKLGLLCKSQLSMKRKTILCRSVTLFSSLRSPCRPRKASSCSGLLQLFVKISPSWWAVVEGGRHIDWWIFHHLSPFRTFSDLKVKCNLHFVCRH